MLGIGDACKHREVQRFTELLSSWSGSQGYCMYADSFVFNTQLFLGKQNSTPMMISIWS